VNEGSRRINAGILLIGAFFTIGAVLRLILLDADPAYSQWYGAVVDEGRWTAAVREWFLFGSVDFSAPFTRLHLVLAPAFQAITLGFFKVLGVGFESARLVSSLSGIGLLTGSILFLRKRLSTEGLALVALALAIQPDLLFLSRLAVPEAAVMLFEFLAFALLLSRPWSETRAFGAGLVTAMALVIKATAAPIVPALAVSAVLIHRVEGKGSGFRRLGAFGLGLAAPALLAIPVAMSLASFSGDSQLGAAMVDILGVLELNTAYGMLATPFTASFGPALYALLLPAWLIAGVLVAAGGTPSHPARVVYWTSAMWALGWLIPSAALEYFPDRYTQHAFVPLAINIGAGLTLIQTLGAEKIRAAVGGTGGGRRVITAVWFALPGAVLLSPLLMTLSRFAGFDEARLRFQIPTVLLLAVVLASAQSLLKQGKSVTFALITLPLAFAPLWFFGTHTGVISGSFWDLGFADALWKLVLLAIAAATAILIGRTLNRELPLRRWAYAYPALIAGLWLAQIGPRYLKPSYATLEASAAVVAIVDEDTLVGSRFASSVFLGNRLRYTERLRDPNTRLDVLVAAYLPLDPTLVEAYRLVARYEIAGMTCVGDGCAEGWEPTVWIYQRNPSLP
jgi:hypothetical protein